MTDDEFRKKLRDYLYPPSSNVVGIAIPIMRNGDGSIDREGTLGMVCYSNLKMEDANE